MLQHKTFRSSYARNRRRQSEKYLPPWTSDSPRNNAGIRLVEHGNPNGIALCDNIYDFRKFCYPICLVCPTLLQVPVVFPFPRLRNAPNSRLYFSEEQAWNSSHPYIPVFRSGTSCLCSNVGKCSSVTFHPPVDSYSPVSSTIPHSTSAFLHTFFLFNFTKYSLH